MQPPASIIVPIRVGHPVFSCYLDNLVYCLKSIQVQNTSFEFLLIDYGSIEPFSKSIKALAARFKAKYIRGEGPIWSRSRSLNIGIKYATGDHTLFVDSDCVIPSNYIKQHIEVGSIHNIFTYSPVYDTNKNVTKSHNTEKLKKYTTKETRPAGWSHMCVSRQWLINNGGFDEEYVGWGAEDSDLFLRLKIGGIRAVEVSTYPYHLWHPQYADLMAKIGKKREFEKILKANRNRYFTLRNKHKKK